MATNPNPQAYKVNVSAQINTNAQPEHIFYEMELYKTDWVGNKTHALKPTGKHPLQMGNKTQEHESLPLTDPLETCYILSIDIYRKVGVEFVKMTTTPQTAIVSLKGFLRGGEAWGASQPFKYYETTQPTQPSKNGEINTYVLNISSKPRIFEAKEHPLGDPLDPFTLKNIEVELKLRMTRPSLDISDDPLMKSLPIKDQLETKRIRFYPNQDRSMLCGAAAFFYCLQENRPDIYQQVIKELWETGKTKIGSLEIEPSNGTRKPNNFFYTNTGITKVTAIDWITLASLRDTESYFISLDKPRGLFNDLASITIAGTLEKWFHKVGCKTLFDNIKYTWHSNLTDICQLNNYVKPNNHVVTLISAGMLKQGAKSPFKDHWIVWTGKLRLKRTKPTDPASIEVTSSTSLDALVELELFSWGNVTQQLEDDLTLGQFLKHTFGGMVFNKIP